jgi:thiol-disulfide isomerase/thioredoxin
MKINFIYLIIAITLFSCNSENKIDNEKNNAVVVVEIANAENEELVLSVQGEDFEDRKTQTVEDGKAIFEINISNSDVGIIESNYNLENVKFMRNFIPLLLNKDTIVVNTEIVRDSVQINDSEYLTYYNFNNNIYKKNKRNIVYRENSKKLFDLVKGITYSQSTLDSLNKKILPEIRSKAIRLFNEEFSNLNDRIQLELLHHLLNFTAFEPKFLGDENRTEINNIYYKLSDLDKSASYRLKTVEYSISNINNYGKENQLNFKNFSLININNDHIKLNNITKQNKLTVFYFWFSGCGPCRSFNQSIKSEIINKLSENNIEFVSINTDFNKEDWIKASKKDNISWRNLYGGNLRDDIEFEYKIRGYPTKIVFNNNNEFIEFSFSKPDDLLKLIKLKKKIK